jgi:NAD(P)-dependent dehydrogenase (short-subunit alcohol dehydrogenase family)
MYNPFTLQDKVILVTGASSGIGKGIAIECAKLGAKLIITGRNPERLNDTLNNLFGVDHTSVIADISTDEGISSLCENLPQLDGVVHVAGIVKPKPFPFLNRQELELIMNTNFYGPVLLTNMLLRKKLIKKNSSLVFISSVSGTMCSFVGGSSYSASKGALHGILKGIALDLAPKGIRVNSIMPGMIDTGIFDNSSISKEDLVEDRKRYPLGRYGKPEDVAFAAIYLLSDASSWVTGSNILLDGGYTLI